MNRGRDVRKVKMVKFVRCEKSGILISFLYEEVVNIHDYHVLSLVFGAVVVGHI